MPGLSYNEGDWYAIPLPRGGFAVGVIARTMPRKEGVLLGYFFGPRREKIPALEELAGLCASGAILVERFGHLGIVQGAWPLVGHAVRWERKDWPTPAFGRFEELTGRAFKVIYDDTNPNRLIREEQVNPDELINMPKDGLSGAEAVGKVLARLLSD